MNGNWIFDIDNKEITTTNRSKNKKSLGDEERIELTSSFEERVDS
jgi:hypothetical protein